MLNKWMARSAIALSILCIMVITTSVVIARSTTVYNYLGRTISNWKSRSVSVTSAAYRDSSVTVLIYARGNCPACAASASALKELVKTVKPLRNVSTRLVTPRNVEDEQEYARTIGLDQSAIVVAKRLEMEPVKTVPSIVVVNRDGHILYRQTGFITVPPNLTQYLASARK